MAQKPLTVGTTGDYRPLTWLDPKTGHYVGEAIDLVEAFAAAEGYEVTFVPTTWPTMMSDLQAGRFQMAAGGISDTPEREQEVLVSDPVGTTGKVALVRCGDEAKYGSLDAIDQAGTRVVENRGGTNQRFALTEMDKAVVIVVPSNAMPFEYIRDGKADVMFTDSTEATYYEQQHSGLCAVHPDQPYTHVDKVFLFRRDEKALHDAFDAWFASHKPAVDAQN
jgi:cyclohexadienyl dehydratase